MSHNADTGGGVGGRQAVPFNLSEYKKRYNQSLADREAFWRDQAGRVDWLTPFATVVAEDFKAPSVKWFLEGRLNVIANVLTRHLDTRGDALALAEIGADGKLEQYSYAELYGQVEAAAKALAALGLSGDQKVALYMPNRSKGVILQLACAWLGIPSVPIARRFPTERALHCLQEAEAAVALVCDDGGESNYEKRLGELAGLAEDVRFISVGASARNGAMSWQDFIAGGSAQPLPEPAQVEAEGLLMVLYGKSLLGSPMGAEFAAGGYLVHAAASTNWIFADGKEDDPAAMRTLCTVDLASAAGQSYGFWGPLLNGGSIVLCDTATPVCVARLTSALTLAPLDLLCKPALISAVKDELNGADFPGGKHFERVVSIDDSLSPRQVTFAGTNLTDSPTKVLNCWVQNETGVALISTLSGAELNRAGSLGLPSFGIKPQILSDFGEPCKTNISGQLAFETSWPAMIRRVHGHDNRLTQAHFSRFPGHYHTNDGMRFDADAFYWFMGRLDDVIKVHGQALATSEVETIISSHPAIAESAVVGIAMDSIDELVAFVVPADISVCNDPKDMDKLAEELCEYVARKIGDFARPSRVTFSSELPRTQTGKVVRRLLRRFATGDVRTDEDLSHVANPESLNWLIKKGGE